MLQLIAHAQKRHPELQAVSSGAIASDYQRLRVEHVRSNHANRLHWTCGSGSPLGHDHLGLAFADVGAPIHEELLGMANTCTGYTKLLLMKMQVKLCRLQAGIPYASLLVRLCQLSNPAMCMM